MLRGFKGGLRNLRVKKSGIASMCTHNKNKVIVDNTSTDGIREKVFTKMNVGGKCFNVL